MANDAGQFHDLTKDIPFAMFTTVSADGTMRSRPMVAMKNAFDGALWFFTRTSSTITKELGADGRVNVTYVSAPEDRFVSVSGSASVVRDAARAEQMWNPTYQEWFPGGAADPDLSLIRIDVTQVEYWDRKVGRMTTL